MKLTKYFRGVAEEAKRVRWPDQKTLWKSVAVVLVIATVAALSTMLSDYLTVLIMRSFENALPTSGAGSSANTAAAIINTIKGGMF